MRHKIGLRTRIYAIISILITISILGGVVMIVYTYRMEGLMNHIVSKAIREFEATEKLLTNLAAQKGFVSYYFMDGDPAWLEKLEENRRGFTAQLEKAKSLAETKEQKELIKTIEDEYENYSKLKDQVIICYKNGENVKGRDIHGTVRQLFSHILELCGKYRDLTKANILMLKEKSSAQAAKLRIVAETAIIIILIMNTLLLFILINDILEPVRRLAQKASRNDTGGQPNNEVMALKNGVQGLIQEYDQAYSELEKSRRYLLQAEKLAMVGKLAAGTSHSIRNPLTSVKMRLFSLRKSLELNDTQKEDFTVISEEIAHIDNILQNFLEFSRPPKLKLKKISPSDVVDQAVGLLRHRVESCDETITVERDKRLPETLLDPDQLKEALANIVINACEAIGPGGAITIREEEKRKGKDILVVIRVSDNGPGIPENIRERIFEPFFTTKEDGTGLGLSIVAKIVEEHGGEVSVESQEGKGASFTITLPVKNPEGTAL